MIGIDNALYYLQHHNKNLTKEQEKRIESIREYREGKYGFDDLLRIVENRDLMTAVDYLESVGARVYSKETLIAFIIALYRALKDTYSLYCYENIKTFFEEKFKHHLNQLEQEHE